MGYRTEKKKVSVALYDIEFKVRKFLFFSQKRMYM